MTSSLVIRNPLESEVQFLKNEWTLNFTEDSEEYIEHFFTKMFKKENAWVLSDDSGVIYCVLHTIPKDVVINEKVVPTALILAVSTPKKYRRKGYMRILLSEVLEKHAPNLTYIQAYNWDVYRTFGYKDMFFVREWKIDIKNKKRNSLQCVEPSPKHLVNIYKNMVTNFDGYQVRDEHYYKNKLEIAKITGTKFVVTKDAYIEIYDDQIIDYGYKDLGKFLDLVASQEQVMKVKMPSTLMVDHKDISIGEAELFAQVRNVSDYNEFSCEKLLWNEHI